MLHTLSFTALPWILPLVGTLFIVQLVYILLFYNRLHRHNAAVRKEKAASEPQQPPLSVVLYAHNEADRLRELLPAILRQDYPTFEVIVVNDASTDGTEELLEIMEKEHHNLRHSFTPSSARYISHKKLALTLGIKASKYEWLVFTETDCMPASNQWLRLLARNFAPQTQIVLGCSCYETGKGFMQPFIAFDSFLQSARYLAAALARTPYMGTGRNLAYRKELFFAAKGFSAHLNLRRGEDDLFVNQTANSHNTRVETDSKAVVHIRPMRGKDWREERIGYLATSRYRRGAFPLVWAIDTATRLLFYAATVAGIVLAVQGKDWLTAAVAATLWAMHLTLQVIVYARTVAEMGGNRKCLLLLPLLNIVQPLQTAVFSIRCLCRNRHEFMRK